MIKKLLAFITGTSTPRDPPPETSAATGRSDLTKELEERYVKLVELSKVKCQLLRRAYKTIWPEGQDARFQAGVASTG